MSDLTKCNFCKYYDLVGPAIKEHKKVEMRVEDKNVVNPAQALYIDGEFIAWFMELPEKCVC